MTVPNTNTKVTYQGDGVTTVFPITYPYISEDYLVVVKIDAAGNEAVLAQDYFVDTVANTVTYPGYPPGEEPPAAQQPPVLAAGEKLLIYRKTNMTQELPMPAEAITKTLESMIDKNTMCIQELSEDVSRAIILPVSADFSGQLPSPVVPGASIAITEDGTGFRYGADPDGITQAVDASDQALAIVNEIRQKINEILDLKGILFELNANNEIMPIERDNFTGEVTGAEDLAQTFGSVSAGQVNIVNTPPDDIAAQSYIYDSGDGRVRKKLLADVKSELGIAADVVTKSDLPPAVHAKGLLSAAGAAVSCVLPKLTFGVVKNSSGSYASVCVKCTDATASVDLFIGFVDTYSTGTEADSIAVTAGADWYVIDSNAGYTAGQAYRVEVLDKTNQDYYRVAAVVTNSGTSGSADMAAMVVTLYE